MRRNSGMLRQSIWIDAMGFTWEKITYRGSDAAEITGYEGQLPDLKIPEEMEGLPVRSIAAHAFSGRSDIRSVVLPESLVTMHLFAFYNCPRLETMELYNSADDYYDGVIRQCPLLRTITVRCVQPENYVVIRSMLQDVDVTLTFRLLDPEGRERIRLTFPEYVNEAKEDTMARAIHFSIEGAGMAYRECVGKRTLDLAGYDRLLGRLTDYDFDVAARIAFGRLLYPEGLSEQAEGGYESFLRDNDEKTLRFLIREDEEHSSMEEIRLMTGRSLIGEEGLKTALEEASELGRSEVCSALMEYRAQSGSGSGAGETLRLDW